MRGPEPESGAPGLFFQGIWSETVFLMNGLGDRLGARGMPDDKDVTAAIIVLMSVCVSMVLIACSARARVDVERGGRRYHGEAEARVAISTDVR